MQSSIRAIPAASTKANVIHYRYPKIRKVANAIKEVRMAGHEGDVHFVGTEKLHGCNIGFQVGSDGAYVVQSRNQIVEETCNSSINGVREWMDKNSQVMVDIAFNITKENMLYEPLSTDEHDERVILFGEWCGKNVQSKVALTTCPFMFVLFDVAMVVDGGFVWLKREKIKKIENIPEINFYNIHNFTVKEVTLSTREKCGEALCFINEETCKIDKLSPFVKDLNGVEGVGEGLVWTTELTLKERHAKYSNNWCIQCKFKSKGKRHRVINTNNIKYDVETLGNIQKAVEYAITENRLTQCVQELGLEKHSTANTRKVIKWMIKDVQSEEDLTFAENKLNINNFNKKAAYAVKCMYEKLYC